ncbi:heavy-metal-associated domain-containing protein [Flavobacterium sp.]|jgi:copper chaperone CopZ|uniref:heavy-metal-associated domain-containing protein n=1 Tax=Flavobacterium sp. TaxID=239 RepID=UPI0037C01AB5
MKNILITFIALFFAIESNAQIVKADIIATGLTCSMCSKSIYKQLSSLPEVASVDTDLNTNTFTVTMKPNTNVSPKIFKENVEKAGFFIGSLVVSVNPKTLEKYIHVEKKQVPNTKQVQVQILDKGFVTDKEFKKLAKKHKDVPTNTAGNENNFHFRIVN